MTPTEVADVQKSFALVAPIADQAGMMFYERLFVLDPSLRPMFADDLTEQSRKLMHVLAVVANGLSKPDALVPIVQALGAKHVDYGVKDKDYDTVGQALIWTLEKGLAGSFTPQVKSAWLSAYTLLSSIKGRCGQTRFRPSLKNPQQATITKRESGHGSLIA